MLSLIFIMIILMIYVLIIQHQKIVLLKILTLVGVRHVVAEILMDKVIVDLVGVKILIKHVMTIQQVVQVGAVVGMGHRIPHHQRCLRRRLPREHPHWVPCFPLGPRP